MTKRYFSVYALFLPAVVLMTACGDNNSDEPIPEEPKTETISLGTLTFDPDNVWAENNTTAQVKVEGFTFSHSLSEWDTVEGFTPACQSGEGAATYTDPYRVITGEGPTGAGTPYLIGFWSSREGETFAERSCTVARTDGKPFVPEHFLVTNTSYAYYTMERGNDFTHPFTDGDWFKLTAHGIHPDGTEDTADFFLAYCNSGKATDGIVDRWAYFDLTPLGEVTGIYFTLSSSDTGEWGMNTPAYFALGDFTIQQK
ncbi:MAG: DUF4465 domain-containing protein [Muribaculaceae bacterium]|nr:DUF4465 domain-containing protein [Muribaculaceae bacterium]